MQDVKQFLEAKFYSRKKDDNNFWQILQTASENVMVELIISVQHPYYAHSKGFVGGFTNDDFKKEKEQFVQNCSFLESDNDRYNSISFICTWNKEYSINGFSYLHIHPTLWTVLIPANKIYSFFEKFIKHCSYHINHIENTNIYKISNIFVPENIQALVNENIDYFIKERIIKALKFKNKSYSLSFYNEAFFWEHWNSETTTKKFRFNKKHEEQIQEHYNCMINSIVPYSVKLFRERILNLPFFEIIDKNNNIYFRLKTPSQRKRLSKKNKIIEAEWC